MKQEKKQEKKEVKKPVKKPYIVFTGGGTSGHIYPAVAIAKAVVEEERNVELLYFGKKGAMEADFVPRENIPFVALDVQAFPLKPSINLWKAWKKYRQAKKFCLHYFQQKRPDFVVGTGGYVSAPVLAAAEKLGIPVLLHEQNALMGRSNRLMRKKAQCVALSYAEAMKPYLSEKAYTRLVTEGRLYIEKKKQWIWHCGTPLLPGFYQLLQEKKQKDSKLETSESLPKKPREDEEKKITLLVVGGSLGARKLNQSVLQAFSKDSFAELASETLCIQLSTGTRLFEETLHYAKELGLSLQKCEKECAKEQGAYYCAKHEKGKVYIEIHPYLHDFFRYMQKADIMICRSGAGTVSEAALLGKVCLFVPYPYAAHDHQFYNAQALYERGACSLVRDEAFSAEYFCQYLQDILQKPQLQREMQEKMRAWSKREAAQQLAKYLLAKGSFDSIQ